MFCLRTKFLLRGILLTVVTSILCLMCVVFEPSSYQPAQPEASTAINEFKAVDRLVDAKFCKDWAAGSCDYMDRHYPPVPSRKQLARTKQTSQTLRQSVIAVIIYNKEDVSNAPVIFSLYRRFLADVRFCAPVNRTSFASQIASLWGKSVADSLEPLYVDLTEGRPEPVWIAQIAYYCVNAALKDVGTQRPHLKVNGVFFLQDDVILNHWLLSEKMSDLSKSHIMHWSVVYDVDTLKGCGDKKWVYGNESFIDYEKCTVFPNPWPHAGKNKKYVVDFYKNWKAETEPNLAQCWKNKANVTGTDRRAFMGFVDMFYLARRDFDIILPYFEFAKKHELYQEVAVPLGYFSCLQPESFGIISSEGWMRFYFNRTRGVAMRMPFWEFYDAKQTTFSHPFKINSYVKAVMLDGSPEDAAKFAKTSCIFCLINNFSKIFSKFLTDEP